MVKTFLKVINIAYFRISDTFTVTGGGGGGGRELSILMSSVDNIIVISDKIKSTQNTKASERLALVRFPYNYRFS